MEGVGLEPNIDGPGLIGTALDAADTVAVMIQDAGGRIVDHNPALADLVGPITTTIRGGRERDLWVEMQREDGSAFDESDLPGAVALRSGEPRRNTVVRLTRHDGQVRVVQCSSYPITLRDRHLSLTTLTSIVRRSLTSAEWIENEESFRFLTDAAPVGIFITDPEGNSLYANRQAEINTGRRWEEIREMAWHEYVHPDDLERMSKDMLLAIDQGESWLTEYRILRPDKTVRWVRSRGSLILDEDGVSIAMIGTIADVTDLREATRRLEEREERTRAILESAAEGIVSTDRDGVILEFNAAAERIFGYDSTEVVGTVGFVDLLAPPSRQKQSAYWTEQLHGGPSRLVGSDSREVMGQHRDGHDVPIEVVVTEIETTDGTIYTAMIRDLSQHKALTAELEHRATHDELTGLPNRLLLDAQLDVTLVRARNRNTDVGVLSILLDRLNIVAESLGHTAADQLVAETARRIARAIEPAPPPARLGYDQFVVVLDDLDDVADAVEVAQRIIEAINRPFLLDQDEAFATAHVGITVSPNGRLDPAQLIADAGVAMRRAAEQSVTRFEIFDPDMRARVDVQRRVEIAMRHGIERSEFELFYQPIVDLRTSRRVGAEALIRWHRPDEGLVLPAAFIPIAEESGLIVELGAWVINQACRQVAEWHRELGQQCPPVSINLSGRQLADPELIETIASAIVESAADPDLITFEITETTLLSDVDRAVATLDALRGLGVRLSLDDFGTGYSSLTYLCQLPLDMVKIDRSFVSESADINEPIVTMILGLARTLGLDIVAEGVETERQAEQLRSLGCPKAQGFLYARPAPAEHW